MQALKSVQASNKHQAETVSSQKAAVRQSPELVEIEQLEEAIQQAQEVFGVCLHD